MPREVIVPRYQDDHVKLMTKQATTYSRGQVAINECNEVLLNHDDLKVEYRNRLIRRYQDDISDMDDRVQDAENAMWRYQEAVKEYLKSR